MLRASAGVPAAAALAACAGPGSARPTDGGTTPALRPEAVVTALFLQSAETHRLLADVRFPGRRSVLDWWLAQAPDEAPRSRSVARTGQEAMHLNPVFPLWGQIELQAFTPQLTRLWENKATAREVAREIATQANRMLAGPPGRR